MNTPIRTTLTGLAFLVLAVPAGAAGGEGDRGMGGFARELFPPQLVMRHQRDIALSDEQRQAITGAINETRSRTLDLRWRIQDEQNQLEELLREEKVDESAALARADEVMQLEREIKKAHLGMLIRIKNQLDAGQQARLKELPPRQRREHRRRGGDRRHGEPGEHRGPGPGRE